MLYLILSNYRCAVRHRQKNTFMLGLYFMRTLQFNFCYLYHSDHISNPTQASKSLPVKIIQIYCMKSSLVRQGHLWLTKHKSIMKSVMDEIFNPNNLTFPLAYTQRSFEMFYIINLGITLHFL